VGRRKEKKVVFLFLNWLNDVISFQIHNYLLEYDKIVKFFV
jgi:hypothetical protein